MPTVSLPSPALVITCESPPAVAEPAADVADAIALPAALVALPATDAPAEPALLAALDAGVLVLLQPDTTRASAATPATADAILASLIRMVPSGDLGAGRSRAAGQ